MPFIWSKDMEVGNPLLDSEHQELLEKINDFMSACSQGKGRSEILSTIQFLKNYTKTHLEHEEELQRKSGYPDYQNHKRLHQKFVDEVNRLEKQFSQQGETIVMVGEINQQLGNWLISHIKTEDTKLTAFLNSHPVS